MDIKELIRIQGIGKIVNNFVVINSYGNFWIVSLWIRIRRKEHQLAQEKNKDITKRYADVYGDKKVFADGL